MKRVGVSSFKYRLLLQKAYFEKGYGLTNYFFKLVAIFGLTSSLLKETFIILFFYTFICYLLGRYWFKHDWIELEAEVGNQYNMFQREMRERFK